ncbi:heat shock 67B2 [Fusarium mundagurra]|uniref:Heat shock 67B2 n=1 Tax=Fusarium mundagurra TaxID=1567541 RepID=A0A8H5YSQ5_9HYPO|nr:heat shock 67B2 [Fusarium mundagurra]
MACRRALFSSASRASAAIQPARPIFITAARSTSPSLPSRAFAPFPSTRSYATKAQTKAQTKTKSIDDNAPPDPKPWSFEEIKNHVEKSDPGNVVLIDVREPVELFETGKIPGAINIPITSAAQSFHISDEDFEDMYGFQRPAKNKELVFYCKAGVRARAAAQLAHYAGWDKIGDYAGSWLDWEAQKGPVEKVKKRY